MKNIATKIKRLVCRLLKHEWEFWIGEDKGSTAKCARCHLKVENFMTEEERAAMRALMTQSYHLSSLLEESTNILIGRLNK